MTAVVTAPAHKIRKMFASVLPSVGTDQRFPILCSVHIEISQDATVARATDRYTIARYELTDRDRDGVVSTVTDGPESIIAREAFIKDVIRAVPARDKKSNASLIIEGDSMRFEYGGTTLTCGSVYGDYPRIEKLMERPEDVDDAPVAFGLTPYVMNTISKCVNALDKNPGAITFKSRGNLKPFDISVDLHPEWTGLAMTARIYGE